MKRRFRDVVLDHLCAYEQALRALFGLCAIVFVLLLVSLTVVEPGTATYVVVVVDLVSVALVGAIVVLILRACRGTE